MCEHTLSHVCTPHSPYLTSGCSTTRTSAQHGHCPAKCSLDLCRDRPRAAAWGQSRRYPEAQAGKCSLGVGPFPTTLRSAWMEQLAREPTSRDITKAEPSATLGTQAPGGLCGARGLGGLRPHPFSVPECHATCTRSTLGSAAWHRRPRAASPSSTRLVVWVSTKAPHHAPTKCGLSSEPQAMGLLQGF